MRLLPLLLSLFLASLAAPAAADVTLRYAGEEGGLSMIIEADDAGNLRAESDNGQALIIRGAEIYLVMPMDDRPVVRFEDALAIAAETRGEAPTTARERSALVDRGPQQVGQWAGRLYLIDPLPPLNGRVRSEIVISTDPALAPAGRHFARVEALQARLFLAAFAAPPSDYLEHSSGLFERGLMLPFV